MSPARLLAAHPGCAGALALAGAWVALTHLGLVGPTLLPRPEEVLGVLAGALRPGSDDASSLLAHARGTATRALAGWILAVLAGAALGVVLGLRRRLHRGSEPLLELARAVPPVLIFPLLLVTFSFGDPAYVGTIVYGCLPVMILTVAREVGRAPRASAEILVVFGASRLRRGLAAALEVVPACFLGARITLSMSLVIAIVTEMVFAPRSGLALGALAKHAEISFDTPRFWAAVVLVGGFGFGANAGLRALGRRLGVHDGDRPRAPRTPGSPRSKMRGR